MLLGWLLSTLFEWASLRGEPHYGRGLPPRYFVPRISLPPALPLERPADVFPVAQVQVDSPTWIVPAGEAYDWPWLREAEVGDETQVVEAATVVARISVEEAKQTKVPVEPRPKRRSARTAPPRSDGTTRLARHRLDPLAPQAGGRRRRGEETGVIEVSGRPSHRVLPGSARRGED
jgi:hypothetical protein